MSDRAGAGGDADGGVGGGATRPGRILVVDDEPANLDLLTDCLEGAGHQVLAARDGDQALRAVARAAPDLVLLDVVMPGMDGYTLCRRLKADRATRHVPVVFITAHDDPAARLDGFRAGGVDYVAKPFQEAEVLARVRAQLEIGRLNAELAASNAELEQRMSDLRRANARLKEEMAAREEAEDARSVADARSAAQAAREGDKWGVEGFVGRSPMIRRTLEDVRRLQDADRVGVLITGESGTGKELIARALHFGSGRSDGPFIPVNCTAIPRDLVESAFFGHVKGAFSGAGTDHRGHFETAHGGTLFLDEIGDMPLELQPKLLRALEDGRVRPVGGRDEVAVDVRVIAATNIDPERHIARGALRQDLYYRLARFVVRVPPLRERREDVLLLADHFLALIAGEMRRPQPRLSTEALAALEAHPFPGNVRELRNVVERALLRCPDDVIGPEHLELASDAGIGSRGGTHGVATAATDDPAAPPRAEPAPEDLILAHVRRHGQIDNTACRELLGVGRRRATYLLDRLVKDGRLTREGERRWTKYVIA